MLLSSNYILIMFNFSRTRSSPILHRLASFALLGLFILFFSSLAVAEQPTPIGPGVSYQSLYQPQGPWAIHLVAADLTEEYLSIRALLGGGERLQRRQLSSIMTAASSDTVRPIAAINADFFALAGGPGLPLGLHVSDGELVTFPDPARSAFYVLDDGRAKIDRLRANAWLRGPADLFYPIGGLNRPVGAAELVLFTPRFGDNCLAGPDSVQLVLSHLTGRLRPNSTIGARVARIARETATPIPPQGAALVARGVAAYALRNLKQGDEVTLLLNLEPEEEQIREAISGGPRLVRNGLISVEHQRERFAETFASRRHPRTGLGIRNGELVMVVVDGRQPGYSDGMTLYEFAQLFMSLGCTDAINLDGGGSTTLVLREAVANAPSGGIQRAVVNALAVFSSAPLGPPVRLALEPSPISVLSGESISIRPRGLDRYYNPVPIDPEQVHWEVASMIGEISDNGVFTAGPVTQSTMGLLTAKKGDLFTSTLIEVTPSPARIVVAPAQATLPRKGTAQFTAQAFDADGNPVIVAPERFHWKLSPETPGAAIDSSGRLSAPDRDLELVVLASVGDTSGKAEVSVGRNLLLVTDFLQEGTWSYDSEPVGVPGQLALAPDPTRPDNRCLRLAYDLSQSSGTRSAHARLNVSLPRSQALNVSVFGDGRGAWLRARLRDAANRAFTVDLANNISWANTWRRLQAPIPEEAESPLLLESIYVVEFRDDRGPAGAIYLDEISVTPSALR